MTQQWINEFPCPLSDTGRKVKGFPPWRKRSLYEYKADPGAPLTFQFCDHGYVRPNKHFETDMGSIPEAAQLLIPKDLHNPSFVLHDSACIEHGLYFSASYDGVYTFCHMPSWRVHRLLRESLSAAGFTCRARLVWFAVRTFGPRWNGK